MNNSANYMKQIKMPNAVVIPRPLPKTSTNIRFKSLKLIEQWRSLAQELKPQMQFDMAFTLEECAQDLDRILKSR